MAKGETDHCRNRLLRFCKGQGVDLGCGAVKIKVDAIGIDLHNPAGIADMKADARVLRNYPDNHFDYVYSSHLLEELQNTEATIKEWLRILKPSGYLVLYQADKDLYYPLGDSRCNPNHKHHFSWESLWEIIEKIGGVELAHHGRYPQEPFNEWSFELVVQKVDPAAPKQERSLEGISFCIPTLNRPQGVEDLVMSVDKTTQDPENIEMLFGIHEEDVATKERIESLQAKVKIEVNYVIIPRHPDGKVHLAFLWNQVYKKARHPIIGYFGDDVIFHTPGWDREVRDEFAKDKTVMVACNDVHVQKGKTATLFFTHRIVHEKMGYYLNDKFRRWYTDTFWDVIYRNAGKLHYRADIVTEHLHPDAFPDRADDTYKKMDDLKHPDIAFWPSAENLAEMERGVKVLRSLA